RLSRANGLAPQRQLAANRGAAGAWVRPVEVGVSDLRAPAQLAPLLEVLAGALRRAGESSTERRQLVPRVRARGRDGDRWRPAVQGRTSGSRSHLRDVGISRR